MGFATILQESEEDGKLRYSLIFDTLKEFEEREYIQFKNDFNDIFPNNDNDDKHQKIIMTIDTSNIETIPFSTLYDFSYNLLDIRKKAEEVLEKTYIMISSQIVLTAFKGIFMICPPISEIEYIIS